MRKPKMILFDYGQTLVKEEGFESLAAVEAVLSKAIKNPYGVTAQEMIAFDRELNREIGRFTKESMDDYKLEVHNHPYQRFLYEYFGLEFKEEPSEIEQLFWDTAAPGVPTDGIEAVLNYLKENDIRVGVISNISFSGEALRRRLASVLPDYDFEFILASSEYVFRKPNKFLFQLALRKAGLQPNEVWYCGDNLLCDINGASEAGIFPIWYTGANKTGGFDYLEDYEASHPDIPLCKVEDWHQFVEYLKQTD
ncbi:HAD family hydrolase [Lachnoclostridium phytofermentans]|uniref:HAD-superfamily hydrolase, subfamily IA, variant 1 n=1 Tax=Lachnoclostridium phytofermentans (strain ATCC 700394 / DSM 18823 / ISDg) TaxID=357809 RepID=A9KT83_LACP7|nr:HAD family hydrolase [Lachnoclostridium phytofermentans]ABX43713.1 HAD-superfamily hydrolase, subfamily IA, variant 1 [Lachnoclostridium phytofermentans ISDg]